MSASTPMSATDARARLRRGDQGAGSTLVRALRLSPELRLGLAGTLALALLATAGRAVVPLVIQQTIDRGLDQQGDGVDLPYVITAVVIAAVAVLVTAGVSAWMNTRLATTVELTLGGYTSIADLRNALLEHARL